MITASHIILDILKEGRHKRIDNYYYGPIFRSPQAERWIGYTTPEAKELDKPGYYMSRPRFGILEGSKVGLFRLEKKYSLTAMVIVDLAHPQSLDVVRALIRAEAIVLRDPGVIQIVGA
jgi:hypothetical protein